MRVSPTVSLEYLIPFLTIEYDSSGRDTTHGKW